MGRAMKQLRAEVFMCWHLSSIGLFGRVGWSVGFLNGAIWAVERWWGLSPTPRLASPARLTMGGLSTARSMPCMALMGYPQVPLCICLWILWNIAVEHWGRTHVRMTFVTCDVRLVNVTSS
jgi:hypothetical protein